MTGVGSEFPISPEKARELTPALSHGFKGAAMVRRLHKREKT